MGTDKSHGTLRSLSDSSISSTRLFGLNYAWHTHTHTRTHMYTPQEPHILGVNHRASKTYLYIHIYIYIYTHTQTHIIYTYICVYTHKYTQTYTHIHTSTAPALHILGADTWGFEHQHDALACVRHRKAPVCVHANVQAGKFT